MTGKKTTPTLQDIWRKLGEQDAKLEQIHSEVKYTNGKVKLLEAWKADVDAVETFKKEHPELFKQQEQPQQQSQEKEGWTAREKTLTAIILSLLAIISALVGVGAIKP